MLQEMKIAEPGDLDRRQVVAEIGRGHVRNVFFEAEALAQLDRPAPRLAVLGGNQHEDVALLTGKKLVGRNDRKAPLAAIRKLAGIDEAADIEAQPGKTAHEADPFEIDRKDKNPARPGERAKSLWRERLRSRCRRRRSLLPDLQGDRTFAVCFGGLHVMSPEKP
jgi:hypothetical protein